MFVELVQRGRDKKGVVDGRADLDASLRGRYGSDPHHLGTIGLHREVHHSEVVLKSAAKRLAPSKHRIHLVRERCVGNNAFKPLPKFPIGLTMKPNKFARLG